MIKVNTKHLQCKAKGSQLDRNIWCPRLYKKENSKIQGTIFAQFKHHLQLIPGKTPTKGILNNRTSLTHQLLRITGQINQ